MVKPVEDLTRSDIFKAKQVPFLVLKVTYSSDLQEDAAENNELCYHNMANV